MKVNDFILDALKSIGFEVLESEPTHILLTKTVYSFNTVQQKLYQRLRIYTENDGVRITYATVHPSMLITLQDPIGLSSSELMVFARVMDAMNVGVLYKKEE